MNILRCPHIPVVFMMCLSYWSTKLTQAALLNVKTISKTILKSKHLWDRNWISKIVSEMIGIFIFLQLDSDGFVLGLQILDQQRIYDFVIDVM